MSSRSVELLVVLGLMNCAAMPSVVDGGQVIVDAGAVDAGVDSGFLDAGVVDAGCEGACAVTDLRVQFVAGMGPFSRAQHGVELNGNLYVEAHFGGDPACPTSSSPTPDRTLIISGLRVDAGVQTMADGLRVSFLDFDGAISPHPFDSALTARATPRWLDARTLVSFSIEATFDAGTVTGGFAAPHCASLDGR